MELARDVEPAQFVLVARRNNSLSSAGRYAVLGSFGLVTVAIAIAFAIQGAWLILPFAGAELLVLCAAFRIIERHAGDFESISICGDRVLIERWETGAVQRYELNRQWAQVVLRPAATGWGEALALRSHGRDVEFGRHLSDLQRREVVKTLREQLLGRR